MATRWHEPDYSDPNISLVASQPRCGTCGASPPLAALRRKQSSNASFPPIPPGESLGQLNVHWPPIVNFEGDQLLPHRSRRPRLPRTRIRKYYVLPFVHRPPSGDPIHLSLETYLRQDRPEYEAVVVHMGR